MTGSYPIEDIETIRRKSDLTYSEAIALLDAHRGSLAAALIDLERNGRLQEEPAAEQDANAAEQRVYEEERFGQTDDGTSMRHRLWNTRIKLTRKNTAVLNVSVVTALIAFIISRKLVIFGGLAALIFGCDFDLVRDDPAFRGSRPADDIREGIEGLRGKVKKTMSK